MVKKMPHVMVCPLNWGIGHATRCVPLVRVLLDMGAKVTLAGDGYPIAFLKEAFPELPRIHFKGFKVVYPSGKNMAYHMLKSSPGFIAGILREHRDLKRIIHDQNIDIVISDNRFGLWSRDVTSVYITHQLTIKAPGRVRWLEPILRRIHREIIKKFNHCWIPDHKDSPNLSGDLSHGAPIPSNAGYIGPLSRFAGHFQEPEENNTYDLTILLSGPEPQRTLLEEKILRQLQGSSLRACIFRGMPSGPVIPGLSPNITMLSHGSDEKIYRVLSSSGMVICRAGYSTIMDLVALGKKALLVPTPGQTEQEYLAWHLQEQGWFNFISQEELDVSRIDPGSYPYSPPRDFFDVSLPRSIIRKLVHDHGS